LAIELAAARCAVLTVDQIVSHLDQRFQLLSSGRRRGRERHRTLRETINWSYELLDERERDLYGRLAVFIDWFALDDATAVAGGAREMEVLDVLEGLVARSLLMVSEVAGTARYRYLESIRDHAWELVEQDGRADALMLVLADHLAEKLSALAKQVWDGPDGDALAAMGGLLSLQRHAADWCVSCVDVQRATRLLLPYAHVLPNGYPPAFEVAERLARVAEQTGGRDSAVITLQLLQQIYRRDFHRYFDLMPQIVEVLDVDALSPPMMSALYFLATVAGDDALSPRLPSSAFRTGGGLETYLRQWHQTAIDVDDMLTMVDLMPTRTGRACILGGACVLAQTEAPDRLEDLAGRMLEMSTDRSSNWMNAWIHKAGYHLNHGALPQALECAGVVTDHALAVGELSMLAPATAVHALVLWKLGCARDAARVRGAAPRRWTVFFQTERDELDRWLTSQFSDEQLRALAIEGRRMELDDLFSVAPAALEAGGKS
ncbi:MAG: hypothetical protein ABIX10_14085, partial [Acidimicrobiales bacterium]